MAYNHIILIIILEIILGSVLIYFIKRLDDAVLMMQKEILFLRKDIVKVLRFARFELSQLITIFSSPLLSKKNYKRLINILFLFSGGNNRIYNTLIFIYKTVRELDKIKKQ